MNLDMQMPHEIYLVKGIQMQMVVMWNCLWNSPWSPRATLEIGLQLWLSP